MHPEEIKAAIRMKGTTPSALADKLGVSRSSVSHVINGRGVSARIQKSIAKVTGLPVSTLWPPKTGTVLRRAKPPVDEHGFRLDAKTIGQEKPSAASAAA